MEHISEVLKILDGALKANTSMALNYAGLLADKLELSGDAKQAKLIRERLARTPAAIVNAQEAAHGGISFTSLPVDGDSRLHTVDVSKPTLGESNLLLPSAIEQQVADFLDNVRYYDRLTEVGASMPNRLLAYGPPGTGKTKLARRIAATLNLPLLTVRCDTLISSLLGQTSRNLRRVFEYSEQVPCILFLDEFDALAGARGNDRDIGELQRVVIALLQNIDAMPENTILIAATNHDQLLDPAVWRRFSFRLPMPMPDKKLRELLWRQYLDSFTPADLDFDSLSSGSEGITGAVVEQVAIDSKRKAVLAGSSTIEENQLFRKLGTTIALVSGVQLSTVEAEISWLRSWDPKRFSLRVLGKIYGLSTRHITNILKEKDVDGKEKGVRSRAKKTI